MGKFLKIAGIGVGVVVVGVGGLLTVLSLKKPAMRPPSTETVERTPERLARGKYLVHHVAECVGCHSDRIVERYGMPLTPGREGVGGFQFDEKIGFPGVVRAQNITSDKETGIGSWTDGEVLRAFREGIDRTGRPLFPMMPYPYYRSMSDEDARSVVVYLRTLPPVKNAVPLGTLKFPVNLMVKFAPKPVEGTVTAPDDARDHLGYGKYLVTLAGCRECHTPHDDKGQLLPGKDFSGGWEMRGPWGRNFTANITPHPSTYMGKATREEFIGRFKAFASLDGENAPVAQPGRNTVMPWLAYAGMTEQDLGAIYDYLKTVPAIDHQVVTFPDSPPPPRS